jgi:hypothetical protein
MLKSVEQLPDAPCTDYTAPRTLLEQTLRDIWSEVLGVSPVGVHADFFALGGQSLLAMQVMSRISTAFHVELSVATLFAQPTVAGLAVAVETALAEAVSALTEDETRRLLQEADLSSAPDC